MVPIAAAAASSALGSTGSTSTSGGSSGGGYIGETVNLVGGILNGLTDFIVTAIPTKLDKQRKQRIKELTELKSAGELGLTPSQLQEIQVLSQGGIQSAQKEFYQRQADTLRTWDSTSPGMFQVGQVAQDESIRRQQSELDRQILAADRQREQEQLKEVEQLKADQRARNKQIGESAKSFVTLGLMSGSQAATQAEDRQQTFGNTGIYTGTNPAPQSVIDEAALTASLKAKGKTEEQIKEILALYR